MLKLTCHYDSPAAMAELSMLRTTLDKMEEMEMTNSHLVKRLEKMKANRNALLSQHTRHGKTNGVVQKYNSPSKKKN
ncbi:unnamed protein product [Ranitomeya imitator]|uniref:Uncharacterized protein n=1 Tax=Ranitomeya imitator TaxID=111125 RepID=A0ABN9LLS4_9NEOB|nr:unnamed protein product [Ranitomeya imitator]